MGGSFLIVSLVLSVILWCDLDNLQVVLGLVLVVGLILYDEPVGPMVIAGAALILCGNSLNLRAAAQKPGGDGG